MLAKQNILISIIILSFAFGTCHLVNELKYIGPITPRNFSNQHLPQTPVIKVTDYEDISFMNYEFMLQGYTMQSRLRQKYKCQTCYYILYILHDSMFLLLKTGGQRNANSDDYSKQEYWQIQRVHLQQFQVLSHKDSDIIRQAKQINNRQNAQIFVLEKTTIQFNNSYLFRQSRATLSYKFRFNVNNQIMISGQSSPMIYFWQPCIVGLVFLVLLLATIPFYSSDAWNCFEHQKSCEAIMPFIINGFHFNFIFYAMCTQTYYRGQQCFEPVLNVGLKSWLAFIIVCSVTLGLLIYQFRMILYLKKRLQLKFWANTVTQQINRKKLVLSYVAWFLSLVKMYGIPFVSAFFHKDAAHYLFSVLLVNFFCFVRQNPFKKSQDEKEPKYRPLNLRFLFFYNLTMISLITLNKFYPTFHYQQSYYRQILFVSMVSLIFLAIGCLMNSIGGRYVVKNQLGQQTQHQFENQKAQKKEVAELKQ